MDGSMFVLLLLLSSALSRPYHYINTAIYCRERFTDLATVDSMDDVNRLVNIVDAGYSGSVNTGFGLMEKTQLLSTITGLQESQMKMEIVQLFILEFGMM
ncbi:hypothetical protein M9458_004832, partial [Cirrhinus mrigala]